MIYAGRHLVANGISSCITTTKFYPWQILIAFNTEKPSEIRLNSRKVPQNSALLTMTMIELPPASFLNGYLIPWTSQLKPAVMCGFGRQNWRFQLANKFCNQFDYREWSRFNTALLCIFCPACLLNVSSSRVK